MQVRLSQRIVLNFGELYQKDHSPPLPGFVWQAHFSPSPFPSWWMSDKHFGTPIPLFYSGLFVRGDLSRITIAFPHGKS